MNILIILLLDNNSLIMKDLLKRKVRLSSNNYLQIGMKTFYSSSKVTSQLEFFMVCTQ